VDLTTNFPWSYNRWVHMFIGGGGVKAETGPVSSSEEFPTIREQDLALILADWVRMKIKQAPPLSPGEIDALDLTVIVAELSRGLHARSLSVIYEVLPATPQWEHLRQRLEVQLKVKRAEEQIEYPQRRMPVH
jgi:hypothetical protein